MLRNPQRGGGVSWMQMVGGEGRRRGVSGAAPQRCTEMTSLPPRGRASQPWALASSPCPSPVPSPAHSL